MGQQVKSKQRVADHGEVFTAEREVSAMLDLVKPETERVDSRFLEAATVTVGPTVVENKEANGQNTSPEDGSLEEENKKNGSLENIGLEDKLLDLLRQNPEINATDLSCSLDIGK